MQWVVRSKPNQNISSQAYRNAKIADWDAKYNVLTVGQKANNLMNGNQENIP
jgi:hypothetical protein